MVPRRMELLLGHNHFSSVTVLSSKFSQMLQYYAYGATETSLRSHGWGMNQTFETNRMV